MSSLQLDIPNWLQESLQQIAKEQNCSIEMFATLAITEKLSCLKSSSYTNKINEKGYAKLLKPAQNVDRTLFENAMNKVAD